MELNVKNRKLFNKFDNKIFDKLDVKNKLFLNGSYRHPIFSIFSADVDLYQQLKDSDRDDLKNKLKTIITSEYFNEIKYTIKNDEFKYTRVNDALNNIDLVDIVEKVKVDLHALYQGFMEEITIIYDFSEAITSKQFIKNMKDDIKKFIKKGMKYKALKRSKLLFEATKNKKQLEKVNQQILDVKNGFLYLTIQRLHVLNDGKTKHRGRNTSYQNLKDSVRRLGLLNNDLIKLFNKFTKKNVKKLVKILQKVLNNQVKFNF